MMTRLLCLAGFPLLLSACGSPPQRINLPQPVAAGAITAQNEAALYLNVVEGLLKQDRFGAALAFLDSYAGKQKNVPPRYWLMRGNALLGLHRNGEAADAYVRLSSTPLAAEGWNGQGRVAANRKQWRSATDQFRKAVLAIPANAEFLNNLAYSGMQMGEIGASVSYLRQAHELDPKSGLIRNNLIIALTMSGDLSGANTLMQAITDPRRRQDVEALIRKVAQDKKENG
jgi:tetratricopeptide (TPR) repeat protein